MDASFSSEVLMLILLTSITVIAYMIAINSQGVTRMSLSYLLATVLLATNVFTVVQYANTKATKRLAANYEEKIASEKHRVEETVENKNRLKQKALESAEREKRSVEVIKYTTFLNKAIKLATELQHIKLRDYSLEYDQLTARAQVKKSKAIKLINEFNRLSPTLYYNNETSGSVKTALKKLQKSAQYCKLYYSAENRGQEVAREEIVKSNAQEGLEILSGIKTSINR